MNSIAIIGMACRYAEAHTPSQLWENVLAQRRAFRRIPRVRLNLADYSPENQADDHIAATAAAVLYDYEFDRSRFHVSQDTFIATDLTHWLALELGFAGNCRRQTARCRREATGAHGRLRGEFTYRRILPR